MCLGCGNGKPSDHHGNPDHIVIRDLERAAEADSISVREAAERIQRGEFGEGEGHLTRERLERAARAGNISAEQTADNIRKSVDEYAARSRPVFQEAPSDAGPG